ncbi:MAG: hypothetical protein LBS34_02040, partial [Rickettsiales bacterium]|nr:hypothetical protein [Rickettsiales bacterium]
MENEYLNIILDFAREAGDIALKYQENLLVANLKKDASIVTEADLAISKLFSKRIHKFLEQGNHKLLDEENLPNIHELFDNNVEYLWTLDPIDG